LQLLGRGSGYEPHLPAVADAVTAGELAHSIPHGIGLVARKIGAPAVQPLVLRQQLGPVALERIEEVLARPRPQVEEVRPDPGRSRGAGFANDVSEQLRPVTEPR
jgi:hypothetical protein